MKLEVQEQNGDGVLVVESDYIHIKQQDGQYFLRVGDGAMEIQVAGKIGATEQPAGAWLKAYVDDTPLPPQKLAATKAAIRNKVLGRSTRELVPCKVPGCDYGPMILSSLYRHITKTHKLDYDDYMREHEPERVVRRTSRAAGKPRVTKQHPCGICGQPVGNTVLWKHVEAKHPDTTYADYKERYSPPMLTRFLNKGIRPEHHGAGHQAITAVLTEAGHDMAVVDIIKQARITNPSLNPGSIRSAILYPGSFKRVGWGRWDLVTR